MTSPRISKLEARKRAVEASRRVNEARAAKEKANIDDAAEILVAVSKIAEIEAWRKERLTQLRQQLDVEAARRMDTQRANGGVRVVRMQGRGETLTAIATRTGLGVGVIRMMLRYGTKVENSTASGVSGALGQRGAVDGSTTAAGLGAAEPPADVASA